MPKNVGSAFLIVTIEKTAPPSGGHVFPLIWTIYELIRHIQKTHVVTKFHDVWTKNVTSREKLPAPWWPCFSPIWTIFELVRDINETNVLTKFHDDWAKIVTSRVFTMNTAPPPGGHFHDDWAKIVTSRVFTRNTAPPPGGHVFQRT
ncbi:hypothetical protein DPMN_023274 [Dreissena polymorpha]|uniref:Uncharacterized protein n=1 Tax=Dreissena polymorpha TaxID=45954 RepID=A0A9D4LLY8_DREPO|nr:hypothetical protein DPMN_023274 [Dreissena polymorpha]